MGLDVMSRSVRVRYTMSNSPSPSIRHRSLDPDRSMSDGPFNKSLTPNRKHHKLLKDGSEVWSEDVEKVFVEGLKQYWESPWATYSRGRSRWRNQFLVEHLKKNGIERSKKQVASHIQVLRNMWRGEPEFHLVAGGEELFQENGLLSPNKMSRSPEQRNTHQRLSPPELISSASSADYSSLTDYAPQPLPTMSLPSGPTSSVRACPPYASAQSMYHGASSSSSLAAALGTPPPSPHNERIRASITLEPLHMGTGLFTLPTGCPGVSGSSSGTGGSAHHSGYLTPADVATASSYIAPPQNRVLSLSLWANGMSMFTMDVDRLSAQMTTLQPHSSQLPSILLRTRVSVPAVNDVHSSPNLNGIFGAVTFAARWQSEAKCITTLYAGQSCIRQEVGYLDSLETSHIHHPDALTAQSVTCTLPESSLSSCRWIDSSQDLITQQIVIDGVVLAAFVYHLERTVVSRGAPSAELIGVQRYRPTVRRRTSSQHAQQFTPPRSPVPIPPQAASAAVAPGSYFSASTYTTPLMPQAAGYATTPRAPSTVAGAGGSNGNSRSSGGVVPQSLVYSATTPGGVYGSKPQAIGGHYYPAS